MELITGENDSGRRLDRILRKALPDYPLPLIHKLLRKGKISVNGKSAKADYRLNSGDTIRLPSISFIDNLKQKQTNSVKHIQIEKHQFELKNTLQIIWQNEGLLAVNKPAGLVIHGENSLDTLVQSYLAEKLPASLSFKPGPLHRLDLQTSGIVIFSTNIEGARIFSKLMRERKLKKTYIAILNGIINDEELWEDELIRNKKLKKTFVSGIHNSGNAITKIKPLAANENYSLVTAELITGRTHQIRAQAASRGHPLAGDKKYGGYFLHNEKPDISKLCSCNFFLHAWKLEFLDYKIEAPLPQYFKEKIKKII